MVLAMSIWSLLVALAGALAQEVALDPELLPTSGLATEDGPGALWINPSNLSYDPDPRWGVFVRGAPSDDTTPLTVAATAGIGGVGAGIRWMRHAQGNTDVALDLAASLRLPRRLSIGAALHWNIERLSDNYVAFDAAASWRPLPWFGLTAITRNIGNPGGDLEALPATGVGIAVRPIGRALLLGADFLHTFGEGAPGSVFGVSARVRPARGLFLRARLDSKLRLSAGLEVFFGAAGVGLQTSTGDYQGVPDMVAFMGSDEPRENIAPPRRRIDALSLDSTPEYAPAQRLLGKHDPSWLDVLQELEQVRTDPGVRGILLTLGDVELPWARWEELRASIDELRLGGKAVVVYLTGSPGNGAVYAASAASKILLHPASVVDLTGLSLDLVHVHGVLDAVGVDVQVVRRADYKTAAEPLTHLQPSEAQRAQQEAVLDQLYEELITNVASGRQRTPTEVSRWIDEGPHSAAEAEHLGLIDARAYPDQIDRHLEEIYGKGVRRIHLSNQSQARSAWEPPAEIATIWIEGPIVAGETREGVLGGVSTGSTTVRALLEKAARAINVRAVVLRIDSPGGSTWASDEIWRAILQVKAAGKPVVASLGGTATSGGYYLATAADAVWAEPNTITGSIGVLAIKPSFGRLASSLGVTTTQLARGRNAGLDSPWVPWDPIQRDQMQAIVDDAYGTFLDRVVHGRNLPLADVERLAGGRIWTGRDALRLGLVDQLGGLEDALNDARERAGLNERYPVAYVTPRLRRNLLEVLLPRLTVRAGPQVPTVSLAMEAARVAGLDAWLTVLMSSSSPQPAVWMIDPWWMKPDIR
jgi:protease-4